LVSEDRSSTIADLESAANHDHFTRLQRRKGSMDPSSKLLLEEIEKKLVVMDLKWGQWVGDFNRAKEDRLTALENSRAEFDSWRPKFDVAMEDVKLELHKMNKQWDHAARYMAGADSSILGKPDPLLDPRLQDPLGTAKNHATGSRGMGR
jgi:hypothetical protein